MNRKKFFSSVFASGLSIPSLAGSKIWNEEEPDYAPVIPPSLGRGDTIGITCPAGYISLEDIQPSIKLIESWGFKVRPGSTVGKRDFSFGGTDPERIADLQEMIDDPSIKAIMCARGGYGCVRLVDQLDFSALGRQPKWIIGFSDITVIHTHLNRNFGVASIHSKMCNSFPDDWSKADPVQVETILSIKQALTGSVMKYSWMPKAQNREGVAEAVLVGGNLNIIEGMIGTSSDLVTTGKILFLEDTNEYLYSVDRMLWHLKRSGKLSRLAALIIGGFKTKPDDPGEEFGRTVYDIVWEQVKEFNYPVCFDFPVGHQKNNFALKCGVPHRLSVKSDEVQLREL
jgi:muramoyltetrapeptide carboxypeptidase